MEPMLIQDFKYGQVPQIIVNLMEYFRRHNLNPNANDVIVGFIYLLMIEYGFAHKDYEGPITDRDFNYQRLLQHSRTLPQNWKSIDKYHIEFILKSAPSLVCSIIVIKVADDLLINCTIGQGGCFSLLVDPLSYITSSKVQVDCYNFQNLDKLSLKFKSKIAWPAKFTMVQINGDICACFQHLPYELFCYILRYLGVRELLDLAATSQDMCIAVKNKTIWIKALNHFYTQAGRFISKELLYETKFSPALDEILATGHRFCW